MSETMLQNDSSNRILARLSQADFRLIAPHLEKVDLPARHQIEARHRPILHVYFIERGIAAIVANGCADRGMELGIIGREGMTGLPVILGTDRSPHDTMVQIAGDGRRIAAEHLRRATDESASLRRSLMRYGHAFVVQIAQAALANGVCKTEERLARWLLMAHDRVDGDQIAVTHEFLAATLGIKRPGVSIALGQQQRRGLIRRERGAIAIIDRMGLEASANGAYGVSEAELDRMLEPPS